MFSPGCFRLLSACCISGKIKARNILVILKTFFISVERFSFLHVILLVQVTEANHVVALIQI